MTNDGVEFFTKVPQDTVRAMVSSGASAREWATLMALMHHPPNERREIGVNGDYVMNSRDVAEYSGLSSPDAARQAVKGLKDKGVIEVSRIVKRGNAWLSVYRLASTRQNGFTRIEIDTGTRIDTDTGSVLESIHTPRVTHIDSKERKQKVGKADPRVGFVPKYPYPKSAEEVLEFANSVVDKKEWESLCFVLDTEAPIEDFFRANNARGWVLPDGEPIYDWHVMLLRLAQKIERDSQFEPRFT